MKIPKLTPRLALVAKFIADDETFSVKTVADVGTDHAKLPINLVASGVADKAYASDLRKGPIMRAAENCEFYLGEDKGKVSIILGNGTENLPNDYNYLSVTGMGGELIADIISRSDLPEGAVLVLSPMTGAEILRKYLYDNGFSVVRESLAREENRIYTVIKTVKADNAADYGKINEYFSEALISEKCEDLGDYIRIYIKKTETALLGRRTSGKKYGDEEALEELLSEMKKLEASI